MPALNAKGADTKKGPSVLALGSDLSLNHGAVVLLADGVMKWFSYYTNLAGSASRSSLGTRMPVWKTNDRHQLGMNRLAWVEAWFRRVLEKTKPTHVNIEDYALDVDHGIAYQGEVGGAARLAVWHAGIPLRLTDPVSNKMWAALNGGAKKPQVEAAVREEHGVDFGIYNVPKPPKAKNENRQTSEDLCDAYSLAHIAWIEALLRAGEMPLKDLPAKRIQVFNRITKAQPTGLLDREWIQKETP